MPPPFLPSGSTTTVPFAHNSISRSEVYWTIVSKATVYGLSGGFALGAVFGTCIFPLIGTIVGGVIGAALGMVTGIVNGMVIGGVTALSFVPLANQHAFRRTIRAVALLTTLLVTIVVYRLINMPLVADISLHTIPALLAIGFSWWAAGRVISWHVSEHGAPPLLPSPNATIYDPVFLQRLFNGMQSTYELVCRVCSFGFGRRWRRQLIGLMDLQPGMQVLDLMSGTGETWNPILRRIGSSGSITAVDFSPVMIQAARARRHALADHAIIVLEHDALHLSLPTASADAVVCAYGVKTLSAADRDRFVDEVLRIVRPGGIFGIVDISIPPSRLLRIPYVWYLATIVPAIGALLLGNPQSYRMLSHYLLDVQAWRKMHDRFARRGCTVHHYVFFGGCANALVGMKPQQ
jgi:ubiquinone/menaquinone biosynthesis methyltransferase